ncbi:MAG: HAMP domain-containing protein, partial [Kordiimonas sp.]
MYILNPLRVLNNSVSNLKIPTKIISVLALLIAVIAVLAVKGSFSIKNVEKQFHLYADRSESTNKARDIQATILKAEKQVANYIQTSSAESANDVEQLLISVKANIEALAKQTTSAVNLNKLKTIGNEADAYLVAFKRIKKLQEQRDKTITDTLDRFSPVMERQATFIMESAYNNQVADAAFHSGQALRHLLLARQYVSEYILTHEETHFDAALSEFQLINTSTSAMEGALTNRNRQRVARNIGKAQTRYAAGFLEVADITRTQDKIIAEELYAIANKVSENILALTMEFQADQLALGTSVGNQVSEATQSGLLWSLLGLVIAIISGFLVIIQVSSPAKKLALTMAKISGGDLNTELETSKRKDEIGDM